MEGDASFAHGFTFAGHPVAAAIAMANLDVFEREDLCGHVLAKEGEFRQMLETPARAADRRRRARRRLLPGDRAGQGQGDEGELRRRGVGGAAARLPLRRALPQRGLICRADDRGDPVIQLAPPLIADTEQFEEIHDVLHERARRGLGAGPADRPPDAHRPEPARRARPRPCRGGARRPRRRCAGSTSPSSRTRPRGSPAAS